MNGFWLFLNKMCLIPVVSDKIPTFSNARQGFPLAYSEIPGVSFAFNRPLYSLFLSLHFSSSLLSVCIKNCNFLFALGLELRKSFLFREEKANHENGDWTSRSQVQERRIMWTRNLELMTLPKSTTRFSMKQQVLLYFVVLSVVVIFQLVDLYHNHFFNIFLCLSPSLFLYLLPLQVQL